MQLRAPVIFFLLFGANSSREKVQHGLVSPKFDKNSAKWNVFWGRNGIWGAFVVGPLQPKSALFRGTHPTPLKTEIPTLSTKSQTFYAINFFSDSPEGFALLMGQCAALRSLAQLNGVFSLRIAHIAPSLCPESPESPEKVQHVLVSTNSIKIVPNGMFFGAATGSGVLLCWGRCTKIRTFAREPPYPSQK